MMIDNKFKKGDKVQVKKDLKVGKLYYNSNGFGNEFSNRMKIHLGKEATIVWITNDGYILDIDCFHSYTDEMLQYPIDELAKEPYKFNLEVENLIAHMENIHNKKMIDKALDEKLHITNPKEFQKLVDKVY